MASLDERRIQEIVERVVQRLGGTGYTPMPAGGHGQPRPDDEDLAGELADELSGGGFAWHPDALRLGCGHGSVDKGVDHGARQAPAASHVLGHPARSGGADLLGSDVSGQQPQPGLAGDVDDALQPGEDGDQQVTQPGLTSGLVGDQIAAAPDG